MSLLLAVLLATAPATSPETHLEAAVRLVGEGNFTAAIAEARAETAEPQRSQARLYVLHQAGVLEEALDAGLEGLVAVPEDPWLLDRCAYIAISLGAGGLASDLLERLRESADEETWRRSSWMADEASSLRAHREEEEEALVRARWTVGLAGLLALGVAARLALSQNKSARKEEPKQAEVT